MDVFRKRVKENIEKSLRQKGFYNINVEVIQGNIRIESPVIFAWIRLTSIPYKGNVINEVDVNHIIIDSHYQRNGIFTTIMKNLKELKTVNKIKISSVSSESMHSWCRKNNCKQISKFDYLYK